MIKNKKATASEILERVSEFFPSGVSRNMARYYAGKLERRDGVCLRSHLDYSCSVLVYDGSSIREIGDGMSRHRARVLANAIRTGRIGDIHPDIVDNYTHGWYTTRRGLFRSSLMAERCGRISISHTECDLGGRRGHDIRVAMRSHLD